MVKQGDVVGTVLDEFIQKLREDPSIDAQVTESLQDILLNKKNINESTLKEALFDSHKENQ